MNAEKIKAIQEENKQLKQEKERLCHRVEVLEELVNIFLLFYFFKNANYFSI